MKKITLLTFVLMLLGSAAYSQAIYTIPEGVIPLDWKKSGFRGMLMLVNDAPSGVFISFPNDGESIDDLKKRAANFIAPMVSDAKKEDGDIKFKISALPARGADAGDYYLYEGAKSKMQIIMYVREKSATKLIYGYFAKADSKEAKWADEEGKGVKLFEKFYKSLK